MKFNKSQNLAFEKSLKRKACRIESYSPKKQFNTDSEFYEEESVISLNYYQVKKIKVEVMSELEKPVEQYSDDKYYSNCDSLCFCSDCFLNKSIEPVDDLTEKEYEKFISLQKRKSKGVSKWYTDQVPSYDDSKSDVESMEYIPTNMSEITIMPNSKTCDSDCFCFLCYSGKNSEDITDCNDESYENPEKFITLDYFAATMFNFDQISESKVCENDDYCFMCHTHL